MPSLIQRACSTTLPKTSDGAIYDALPWNHLSFASPFDSMIDRGFNTELSLTDHHHALIRMSLTNLSWELSQAQCGTLECLDTLQNHVNKITVRLIRLGEAKPLFLWKLSGILKDAMRYYGTLEWPEDLVGYQAVSRAVLVSTAEIAHAISDAMSLGPFEERHVCSMRMWALLRENMDIIPIVGKKRRSMRSLVMIMAVQCLAKASFLKWEEQNRTETGFFCTASPVGIVENRAYKWQGQPPDTLDFRMRWRKVCSCMSNNKPGMVRKNSRLNRAIARRQRMPKPHSRLRSELLVDDKDSSDETNTDKRLMSSHTTYLQWLLSAWDRIPKMSAALLLKALK